MAALTGIRTIVNKLFINPDTELDLLKIIKIIGFMTIKNEWPLAAVSISHALVHTVDKMYVVDNGSQDGTWQGLKILQEIFPDRLVVIYYESKTYNQQAITHALSQLEPYGKDQSRWGIFLDADEFTIYNGSEPLATFLTRVDLDWHSLVLDLVNYIPNSEFQEYDLGSYASIEYRATGLYRYINERETFRLRAENGEIYWQNWVTKGKVLVRQADWKRLGYGGHNVEYGKGVPDFEHDPFTAIGAESYKLFRAHLPYSSLKRLANRSLLKHVSKKGEPERFFLNKDDRHRLRNFSGMVINKDSKLFADSLDSGLILKDDILAKSISSVFPVLKPRWEELISAQYVRADSTSLNFALLVDMAADYIEKLDNLWRTKN
jgi:hypothetical protein